MDGINTTPSAVNEAIEVGTLSLADTARRLGIGVATAYQLVGRGDFPIPVKHIGSRMKVLKSDLDRYLAGEPVAS